MAGLGRPIVVIAMLGILAIPAHVATAQVQQPPQYAVIDLGTLGGPNSYQNYPGQSLNDRGQAIGQSDTRLSDPGAPDNCFNPSCYLDHPFKWDRGVITDLGALPGPNNDIPVWISQNGHVVGISQNGVVDPLSGSIEFRAVSFENGKVVDLGTLGGNWSAASAVNSLGQIVGLATNTIPDPYGQDLGNPSCCTGFPGTQNRAVLWQGGLTHDLGTLPGGNDAQAGFINESGQVAGESYTSATPNATTGFPTEHPFLWQNGHMLDLGSLGGTAGYATDLNNRGEVSGTMNLAGDQSHHGFLWANGTLIDLGTLGGTNSEAFWMNDAGDVVGRADFSPTDAHHHAFLWRNGVMTDLGTLGGYPNSTAYGVNNQDQVIGDYGGDHGFVWENGQIYDLTSLLVPGSGMRVAAAAFINDRGEIYGTGALPSGDQHVILLEPTQRTTASQGLSISNRGVDSSASFAG